VRGPKRKPRADLDEWAELALVLTGDVAQFRITQAVRRGFLVITNDANPIRVHRAGCFSVKETNFVRKLVQNGMRTWELFGVR
jgi:hypothetical protein